MHWTAGLQMLQLSEYNQIVLMHVAMRGMMPTCWEPSPCPTCKLTRSQALILKATSICRGRRRYDCIHLQESELGTSCMDLADE